MDLSDIKKGFSEARPTGEAGPDAFEKHPDSAAEQSAAESVVVFPDEESKKATEKAMALLLHKDRTEHELHDRLYRAGFSEIASDFAMDYVSRFGYINDLRYACGYIDYHKLTKSKNEIRRKLKERGVSDEILSEAFSTCYDGAETVEGEEPEDVAMRALLTKRLRGREVSELTFEEKQKQMRYLAGKGFPSDRIRRLFS
ncbi:MAG: regulatory protein RecX [Eubacterium sp.]|nr:regulatory protein RecX [Eubacterium sp.]